MLAGISKVASRLSGIVYSALAISLPTVGWMIAFTNPVASASIAQSFSTTETSIAPGAIVSLTRSASNTVELAGSNNVNQLVGIAEDNPLVELSDGAGATVRVATSGVASGLVSDVNGPIKVGDRITASPINGVGMKATQDTVVIGVAQADLNATAQTTSRTIKDKAGTSHVVHVGTVPIQVSVASYTVLPAKTVVPAAVQDLANNVAGHTVSTVRISIAGLILLLVFISVTVLLRSAVRASLISVGRNPLSENALRKSLLEVGLAIVGILSLSLITVYLVLKI